MSNIDTKEIDIFKHFVFFVHHAFSYQLRAGRIPRHANAVRGVPVPFPYIKLYIGNELTDWETQGLAVASLNAIAEPCKGKTRPAFWARRPG